MRIPLLLLCTLLGLHAATEHHLASFGVDDAWTGDGAELSRVDGALVATLPASDDETEVHLSSPILAARTVPLATKLVVTISCDQDGTQIEAEVRDGDGERLRTRRVPIGPDERHIAWDLGSAKAFASSRGRGANGVVDDSVQLERITIVTPEGGPPRRARISSIRVVSQAAPEAQLGWRIDSGNLVPYVTPDTESVPLVIDNPTGTRIGGEIELHLERADHSHAATHRLAVALEPRGRQSLPIPVPAAGWYLLRAELASGGSRYPLPPRSLAVMEPAGPSSYRGDDFHFATCGGVPNRRDPDTLRFMLEAQSLIGIDVVRHDLHWDAINPAENTWREERLDWWEEAAVTAKAYGIEHQVILAYNARWSAAKELQDELQKWQKAPPVIEHWLPYVERVVGRLAPHVRFYEVWNEPDIVQFWNGSYERYSELLAVTHDAIKAIDPELQVLTGGFATIGGHGGKEDPELQAKVMRRDHAHFDILAHHQHGHFHHHAGQVDDLLMPLVREMPEGKRLWFNETATNRNGDRMHDQATCLAKKLAFTWSRGSMGYTWYTFRSGDLTSDRGHNWGLLTSDDQTCAAYVSYNTAVRCLRGLSYRHQLQLGDAQRYGFTFSSDACTTIVLWDESADLGQQVLRVAVPDGAASNPRLVDVYGGEQPLAIHRGHVVVTPGRDPVYLVVDGRAAYAGALVAQVGALPVVVPGRKHPLPLVTGNPSDQVVELTTGWPDEINGPSAHKVPPKTGDLELGASFTTPEDLAVPAGEHHLARVTWSVDDSPWAGAFTLSLRVAVRVPAITRGERPADVAVEAEGFVRDNYRHVPGTLHRTWQGRDDLSFRAWFAHDDSGLGITVAVRDDIHLPRAEAHDGDLLELRLAFPHQDGNWSFRVQLGTEGTADAACTGSPRDFDRPAVTAEAERGDGVTRYHLVLPDAAFGLDRASLEQPFGVNIIARDRDEEGSKPEGWIQYAPQEFWWTPTGNPELFPQVVFARE